jgi:hypothetical protein
MIEQSVAEALEFNKNKFVSAVKTTAKRTVRNIL